jgi:hypothetical protein
MRKLVIRLCAALALAGLGAQAAQAQFAESPQISEFRAYRAIHSLENLIAYLEANPYSYGGRKEATIASARATIRNLRATMGPHYWVPLGCCYQRRPIYVR